MIRNNTIKDIMLGLYLAIYIRKTWKRIGLRSANYETLRSPDLIKDGRRQNPEPLTFLENKTKINYFLSKSVRFLL